MEIGTAVVEMGISVGIPMGVDMGIPTFFCRYGMGMRIRMLSARPT